MVSLMMYLLHCDKTDGKDPKKREYYWMRTLKTLAPEGLKIEESV